MKYNKFVAPIMAGVLSLTLGLAGCGGSSTQTTDTKTEETTEETTEATTEEATEEAADATEEDKIMFWAGTTDKGDTLLYSEEDEKDEATIILFGDHDDQEELLAFSGAVEAGEDNTVTITDSETGDKFTFKLVEVTDEGISIDLGEHGSGTIEPVTEKKFEETVDQIVEVVKQVGEKLESLEEQDVEDLLNILIALSELQES